MLLYTDLNDRLARASRSAELTTAEKDIVIVLSLHRGASNAIRSKELATLVGLMPGESSRRFVAATIETLVLLHQIPVGGLRVPPYGYFLIETRNDLDLAVNARWNEIYAHLRYLRALTSKQDVARLFGQQMLQLERESPEAAA